MAALACARPASAQERVRDFELSAGLSVEGYRGNLNAAAVSAVDSTESATAAIGELGGAATLALLEDQRRWLFLSVDGGMRQFAAGGFQIRDYAPREWVGRSSLSYSQILGTWVGTAQLDWRGRAVQDRPPMPLFLQPGFGIGSVGFGLQSTEVDRVRFDVGVDAEWANYTAREFSGPLDLLDRRTTGIEAGATWTTSAVLRFSGGFRRSVYPNQSTFEASDPHRRDHTVHAAVSWSVVRPDLSAEVGLEGTVNRSNSRRPEYDALAGRALVSVPLPLDVGATLLAVITGKRYVSQSDFTLLVPGEEADNASVVYLDLARPLALGLDGSVRLGWTRAEAEVGDQYFQRFGASLQLRYRPTGF